MRSIDLVFDEELDAAVRDRWRALAELGLPSLASHAGSSNRPHVTLAAGGELELPSSVEFEPFTVELGAVSLFPRRSGYLVARSVVPTDALLDLHRRVLAATSGSFEYTMVDRWSPHVTLARRVDADRLAAAMSVLQTHMGGLATGLRHWDSETATVTDLSATASR